MSKPDSIGEGLAKVGVLAPYQGVGGWHDGRLGFAADLICEALDAAGYTAGESLAEWRRIEALDNFIGDRRKRKAKGLPT